MEKFTSFIIKEAEEISKDKHPVDVEITNIVKKFDYDDLFIYFKGLMLKYLDINYVKKMLPGLDKPDQFTDFTQIFSKLEPLLNVTEKKRFGEMKKIFKKKFEADTEPSEIKAKEDENV